jgi:hypothetical protein
VRREGDLDSTDSLAPAGPMETIRAVAGTKSWPCHDHEGRIDAAKSSGEPPLARLVHSWSSKLDEAVLGMIRISETLA